MHDSFRGVEDGFENRSLKRIVVLAICEVCELRNWFLMTLVPRIECLPVLTRIECLPVLPNWQSFGTRQEIFMTSLTKRLGTNILWRLGTCHLLAVSHSAAKQNWQLNKAIQTQTDTISRWWSSERPNWMSTWWWYAVQVDSRKINDHGNFKFIAWRTLTSSRRSLSVQWALFYCNPHNKCQSCLNAREPFIPPPLGFEEVCEFS